MIRRLANLLGSVGLGNVLLSLILVLSAINLYGNGQILASVRKSESPPVSSTHTVTVGNESFTFTITTPWRAGDTATTLTERHWHDVADAEAKLEELMGT